MITVAKLAITRPRRMLAAISVLLLIAIVLGSQATSALNAVHGFEDPGSQSAHARKQIESATGAEPAPGVIALVRAAPGAAEVGSVERVLRRDPSVARVAPPVSASDGSSELVAATLRTSAEPNKAVAGIQRSFANDDKVTLGGSDVAGRQVSQQAARDLGFAELLVFPILAVLAFFIFRGVAALLPLAVGATSVFAAFAALRAVNVALPLSSFALNLVIGLGLGLSIDYSLFMVSRFREELGAGRDAAAAIHATLATAGRTVLYSAVTVAIAMSSLVVFPLRFLQSMGIGGAVVAVIAAAVALTLLPALFMLLGTRLGQTVPETDRRGRWYRLAAFVLRHCAMVAVLTMTGLLLLALPALRTTWTGVDASVLPTSASAHVVEDRIEQHYPRLTATPAVIAVRAGAESAVSVKGYAARIRALPGLISVAAPLRVGPGIWQINATLRGATTSPSAQRAVAAVRSVSAPFAKDMGGDSAEFADQRAAIANRLSIALAILVAGTLLMLWLMTSSVLLPFMALLMNVLTVGAATGLLVIIFQDGRLTGPLGYTPEGGIQQSNYLVLAAVAFALSTDYGVFLVTRIKEVRDRGTTDSEAIATGIQRTGRLVTTAALLLAVALGAFATSHIIFLKEIGIGAVAAVLIDAFVVRSLLFPALMGLLGPWNWRSPQSLRRLHGLLTRQDNGDQEPGPTAAAGQARGLP
jgi:uncharacterized membrane protein YdfJ with MMPL/SSD domain